MAVGLETDFYGLHQRDHGKHDEDIVPAFTIENPSSDDPPSFPGRNWDERGQAIYNADCAEPAPPPEPERKVRICHATSADKNPTCPTNRRSRTTATSTVGISTTPARSIRRTAGATSSRPTTTSTSKAIRRPFPATTGARRARRSSRTAASRRIRRIRRARSRSSRPSPVSRTLGAASSGPLRIQQSELDDHRAPGESRTAPPPPPHRGQPSASPRGGSRTPSRRSLHRRNHVVPDGEPGDGFERLGKVRRLDHDHQESRPARTTPAASTSRSTARSAVAGPRSETGTTGTIQVPPARTSSASPEPAGRRSPTTT